MKIIWIIVLSFFSVMVYCEEKQQEYNYYKRNNNGTYELNNIDAPDWYKNKFMYSKGIGEMSEKIYGYYYATSRVKFIDHISEGKIIETDYFDYDTGEHIIKKKYQYSNNDIEVIEITGSSISFKYFFIRVFFYRNSSDDIRYTAMRLIEGKRNLYMFSEGVFTNTYNPVTIVSNVIRKEDDFILAKIKEKFVYDKFNEEYFVYIDDILLFYQKKYTNENVESVIQQYYDEEGNCYLERRNEKTENKKSVSVVLKEMQNFFDKRPYEIYIKQISKDITIQYSNEEQYNQGIFSLITADEIVEFKQNIPTRTLLQIDLDIFSDSPYYPNKYTKKYSLQSEA